jgi:NitT/TauT family transport system permease protein
MILGTQWYILFNVDRGCILDFARLAQRSPKICIFAAGYGGAKSRCRRSFRSIVTGAITASGGSWNAAIVAELASWGKEKLVATGIGAYIAEATAAGDQRRTVLGIVVMSLFVVLLNRLFWRPLYAQAERRFRIA